ncbi:MAG TPA: TIGR03667 family PPOX class F420-dependent oxidoreductase [Thermoleophilaceae bacterium]|nr:TIGR03667 family PPOX class F420-dependent oxidoreductase [Thermoleophilaceae bacterium]
MIDESSEFGARVARHLRDEIVVWMTTVSPSGAPVPRPVWFVWDGADSVLVYSRPKTRIRNIESNPHVTLNFDGDGGGGDIVVLSGDAVVDRDAPPAGEMSDYVAKYADHITRIGMTPDSFNARYSVPVRITITRVDGH